MKYIQILSLSTALLLCLDLKTEAKASASCPTAEEVHLNCTGGKCSASSTFGKGWQGTLGDTANNTTLTSKPALPMHLSFGGGTDEPACAYFTNQGTTLYLRQTTPP